MGLKKVGSLVYFLYKILGSGKSVSSGKSSNMAKKIGTKAVGKILGKLFK